MMIERNASRARPPALRITRFPITRLPINDESAYEFLEWLLKNGVVEVAASRKIHAIGMRHWLIMIEEPLVAYGVDAHKKRFVSWCSKEGCRMRRSIELHSLSPVSIGTFQKPAADPPKLVRRPALRRPAIFVPKKPHVQELEARFLRSEFEHHRHGGHRFSRNQKVVIIGSFYGALGTNSIGRTALHWTNSIGTWTNSIGTNSIGTS